MKTISLHDKNRIEAFLRPDTFRNIYQLGDLDDRFWPHTTWYALTDGGETRAIALVYSGLSSPTLLAMGGDDELPAVKELLGSIMRLLPKSFYAHLSLGLANALAGQYRVMSHGKHHKMALTDASKVSAVDTSAAEAVSAADADDLLEFYERSCPAHWFEPDMLDMHPYFVIRRDAGIVSAAGMHVYSKRYGVAALGNIATDDQFRRNGYAAAATAALCKSLLETIEHIGLNVRADNHAALACYRKLGFEVVAAYEECSVAPL